MNELTSLIPKIIFDRSIVQRYGPYFLERKDGTDSFTINIFRNSEKISQIFYDRNGGKVKNIKATKEEINIIMKELDTCLTKKCVLD